MTDSLYLPSTVGVCCVRKALDIYKIMRLVQGAEAGDQRGPDTAVPGIALHILSQRRIMGQIPFQEGLAACNGFLKMALEAPSVFSDDPESLYGAGV